MSLTVCIAAKTLYSPFLGGHLWVYLNWALGLRSLGCQVIWLEAYDPCTPAERVSAYAAALKACLAPYGLAERLALCPLSAAPLPAQLRRDCLELDAAAESDLLLNQYYGLPGEVVGRFRRSALLDIDPGLLQVWIGSGCLQVARHDVYFTIGETVGRDAARVPDLGVAWQYTPPCVCLTCWPVAEPAAGASFTTVSNWSADEWMMDGGEAYSNDKRTGFLPFLDLPSHTAQPLELALCLGATAGDEDERSRLRRRGWRVRDASRVASTPWDYQRYIQESRGEFSCVKPSCLRLQNAWISDRTLCYLASGKPAVVQDTGPSRFLPDRSGLFRFRSAAEAAGCLEVVATHYERERRAARALAEEFFDAGKVARGVLERALG